MHRTSDDTIEREVVDELYADGRFDPRTIAVRVRERIVALRGTVASRAQKEAAVEAAWRVDGIADVRDELIVAQRELDTRADAELRADVLQALADEPTIPEAVDAEVHDGSVVLRGTVVTQLEHDRAEEVAGNVRGVRGVANELAVEYVQLWP